MATTDKGLVRAVRRGAMLFVPCFLILCSLETWGTLIVVRLLRGTSILPVLAQVINDSPVLVTGALYLLPAAASPFLIRLIWKVRWSVLSVFVLYSVAIVSMLFTDPAVFWISQDLRDAGEEMSGKR